MDLWLQQLRHFFKCVFQMFLCFSVDFPGDGKGEAVHVLPTDTPHASPLHCCLPFPIQELWPELETIN